MTIGFSRPTRRIVDCQALYQNIKQTKDHLTDDTVIFAVVKADGYGHGAVKVAEIARKAGATGFCVSLLDEALELRAAGFTEEILVLGAVEVKEVGTLAQARISVTVSSLVWLQEAVVLWQTEKCRVPLSLHLKIDTGMGRLGFVEPDEMVAAAEFISTQPELLLEGIYTHFAKADGVDTSYLELQQKRFTEALRLFPADVKYIHTANSATALWHNHWHSNLIRLGASMYGLNPSGSELEVPYKLQQAMSLVTKVVHVKQISAGDCLSYGAEYQAQADEWIGTLPIGYADGLTRNFKGFQVLIDGQKAQIVGRICMDQCMIRLPYEVAVGTGVTIFGQDGNLINTFQDGAAYVNTINYEIPCLLSQRVPLVYINEELLSL